MKNWILFFVLISSFSISCSNGGGKSSSQDIDTPTAGKIAVVADETVFPIAQAEVEIFTHQYTKANVTLKQRSETDCIQDMYNDSAKAIFIGRDLNIQERKAFEALAYNPIATHIATDAIAFVVHPKNRDTTLTYEQVQQILRGETKTWQQLGGGASGDLTLVFDNANSGTVSYLMAMAGVDKLPSNAFSAKSNLNTINFVAENENAIGVIGWSWVSDSDDPKTRDFLKKIRVVSVAAKGGKTFEKPYQLNLAEEKYPLSRKVYLIQRERRTGLAAGLTAFTHGEIGQTIILKAGLLPSNPQGRDIQIVTKPAPVPTDK
jgi:phosphate transport system substrate-binding protein